MGGPPAEDVITNVRGDDPGTDSDKLFREAVAIRSLLQSLDPDDHDLRSTLLLARDDVRARAASLWSQRGWRAITDHDPASRPGHRGARRVR